MKNQITPELNIGETAYLVTRPENDKVAKHGVHEVTVEGIRIAQRRNRDGDIETNTYYEVQSGRNTYHAYLGEDLHRTLAIANTDAMNKREEALKEIREEKAREQEWQKHQIEEKFAQLKAEAEKLGVTLE